MMLITVPSLILFLVLFIGFSNAKGDNSNDCGDNLNKSGSTKCDDDLKKGLNLSDIHSLWRGIIPGTKWCGLGDEAKHYNDLGKQVDVDKCCRAHDHCPIKLKALEHGYGIINFSLYTRSDCRCDQAFYHCLKASKSPIGDIVGNFYFNIMQTSCIDEARPCKSLFNPLCSNSLIFKGRPDSIPKFILAQNKLKY